MAGEFNTTSCSEIEKRYGVAVAQYISEEMALEASKPTNDNDAILEAQIAYALDERDT